MAKKKLALTMVIATTLAVSSIFSSLPTIVYAQENIESENTSSEQTENSVAKVGEIYQEHLVDAINASSAEQPAVMLKDINDSSEMFAIENKNAVLNTNGFTWKDESQIVDHSGAYDAIYTPDNTEHYETLEVKIDIFMYDKPDTDSPNNDKGIPETGDQTNVGLFTSLFSVNGLGIAVLAVLKKKKVLENK